MVLLYNQIMNIDYTSFVAFANSTYGYTIGQGECWDYINLIWSYLNSRYYTYPPSNPSATNHGVKWGVLNTEARNANIITHLVFISDKTQLKKGDIVVSTDGDFGHAGFINSDYQGDNVTYEFYSQNYNGRRSVGIDRYDLHDFGGAFRYDVWNSTPPYPPISTPKRKHFNWAIYGNELRNKSII